MASNHSHEYEDMGRRWFGVGNLHGSCWFVGMEPGGAEDSAWPVRWDVEFDRAPVVDLHVSAGTAESRWLGEDNELHPTWSPLIRARLAYAGLPADDGSVLDYQRQKFCRAESNEACLEISAYAARDTSVATPRDAYRDERIAALREMLAEYEPEVVVCYGTTYRAYYEALCGGTFDPEGFRWTGATLCALVSHPKPRFKMPLAPEAWAELGTELRLRVEERRVLAAT